MPAHSLLHSNNMTNVLQRDDSFSLSDDSNHSSFAVATNMKKVAQEVEQQEEQEDDDQFDDSMTSSHHDDIDDDDDHDMANSSSSSSVNTSQEQSNNNNNNNNGGIKKTTTKKRVSFEDDEHMNQIYEIVHINDLKQEIDIKQIWYTKDDYDTIIDRCHEIIERYLLIEEDGLTEDELPIMIDENEEEEFNCLRGLELEMEGVLSRSSSNYKPQRRLNIKLAKNNVLNEQDEQDIDGIYDDELLAYACSESSKKSITYAKLVALDDWKEALMVQ